MGGKLFFYYWYRFHLGVKVSTTFLYLALLGEKGKYLTIIRENYRKVKENCKVSVKFHREGKRFPTLLTADILSGKNVRAWVSIDFT